MALQAFVLPQIFKIIDFFRKFGEILRNNLNSNTIYGIITSVCGVFLITGYGSMFISVGRGVFIPPIRSFRKLGMNDDSGGISAFMPYSHPVQSFRFSGAQNPGTDNFISKRSMAGNFYAGDEK